MVVCGATVLDAESAVMSAVDVVVGAVVGALPAKGRTAGTDYIATVRTIGTSVY